MDERIQKVLETFPFLSYGCLHENHYLGIIQNIDNQLLSMYVLDSIPDESRPFFMRCGETWWWDSNRQVPINIFLKDERFKRFRPYLKHFARKDFNLIGGFHGVSLQESIARRVRKRQVTLVRRPD